MEEITEILKLEHPSLMLIQEMKLDEKGRNKNWEEKLENLWGFGMQFQRNMGKNSYNLRTVHNTANPSYNQSQPYNYQSTHNYQNM